MRVQVVQGSSFDSKIQPFCCCVNLYINDVNVNPHRQAFLFFKLKLSRMAVTVNKLHITGYNETHVTILCN